MIYAWFYRTIMRIAHHYNWHYAPAVGPLEDGWTQLWCKWCGFRMSTKRLAADKAIDDILGTEKK